MKLVIDFQLFMNNKYDLFHNNPTNRVKFQKIVSQTQNEANSRHFKKPIKRKSCIPQKIHSNIVDYLSPQPYES